MCVENCTISFRDYFGPLCPLCYATCGFTIWLLNAAHPCTEGAHAASREILVCGSLTENGKPLVRLTGRKSCACQSNCKNKECCIDFPQPALIPKYSVLGWREVSGYGTQRRNLETQMKRRALFPKEQVVESFKATVRAPRNPFAPSIFRLDQTLLNFIRVHEGTIPAPETTPAPGPASNTRSQSLGNNTDHPETAPGLIKEEPIDEDIIDQTPGARTNNPSASEVTTQVPLSTALIDHMAYTRQMQPPATRRTRTK